MNDIKIKLLELEYKDLKSYAFASLAASLVSIYGLVSNLERFNDIETTLFFFTSLIFFISFILFIRRTQRAYEELREALIRKKE